MFDAQPDGTDRFTAATGPASEDERQVVEGTQVMAQAIVAAAKRFPENSIRSAHAVFARAVMVGAPLELLVDVVNEGRSTATAVITAQQNGKRCITVTVLADVPTADVIRHHLPRPDVAAPADSNVSRMPMSERELRLVDVVDVNSPDEVGPPELYAWLHYDPIPARDDLAKALIAYFTGHLGTIHHNACARGHRHFSGAPDGVHRADDRVGQLPRTGRVDRLAALYAREHPGRRGNVVCPRRGAHRGG